MLMRFKIRAVLSKVGLLPVNCFEGRYFDAKSLLLSIFP